MRDELLTIVIATLCALVLQIADGWAHDGSAHAAPVAPPAAEAAPTLH